MNALDTALVITNGGEAGLTLTSSFFNDFVSSCSFFPLALLEMDFPLAGFSILNYATGYVLRYDQCLIVTLSHCHTVSLSHVTLLTMSLQYSYI